MTAIQRFALHGTIMNPHSSGPYVRHEDHLAAMQGRCLAQIEEPAGEAPAAGAPQGERQWICPTRTVADLVNNLLTMDQALPIYGAQYIEKDGRRRAIAVPPTVSRERVQDGRWIGQGEELNAAVVWTRAEQPAAVAGPVLDVRAIAAAVCQRVAELPDRNSPEDWPEAMLVTGQELIDVVTCELEQAQAAPALEAPAAPDTGTLDAELLRLVQSIVELHRKRGCVLTVHIENLADLLDERAALAAAPQAPAAPAEGEVLVEVIGLTGSGKSAICGEIEILCRALGLDVSWPDGDPEKNMTHAEWTAAIEAYKPRVRIVERNVPRQSNGGPAK